MLSLSSLQFLGAQVSESDGGILDAASGTAAAASSETSGQKRAGIDEQENRSSPWNVRDLTGCTRSLLGGYCCVIARAWREPCCRLEVSRLGRRPKIERGEFDVGKGSDWPPEAPFYHSFHLQAHVYSFVSQADTECGEAARRGPRAEVRRRPWQPLRHETGSACCVYVPTDCACVHTRSFRKLPAKEQDDILELLLCQTISVRMRDASGDDARCEAEVLRRFGDQARPADVLDAMDSCRRRSAAAAPDVCGSSSSEAQGRMLVAEARERSRSGSVASPSQRPPAQPQLPAPPPLQPQYEEAASDASAAEPPPPTTRAAAAPQPPFSPKTLPQYPWRLLPAERPADVATPSAAPPFSLPAGLDPSSALSAAQSAAAGAAAALVSGVRSGVAAAREDGPSALAAPLTALGFGLAGAAFAVRSIRGALSGADAASAPPGSSSGAVAPPAPSASNGSATPDRKSVV